MAIRINIQDILKPTSKYPLQRILVDTNVIINYENPFAFVQPILNTKTVDYLNQLKSHYQVNSTLVTALEFFKYVQVGTYNVFTKTQPGHYEDFSTLAFKKLRRISADFTDHWNLRLKAFRRTFQKHFPPYDVTGAVLFTSDLIANFDGSNVDFGDELLFRYSLETEFPLILTSDKDFESFPDNLHVVYI